MADWYRIEMAFELQGDSPEDALARLIADHTLPDGWGVFLKVRREHVPSGRFQQVKCDSSEAINISCDKYAEHNVTEVDWA